LELRFPNNFKRKPLHFAFAAAFLIHLLALSPLAHWITQSLLPSFAEHEIDLELFNVRPEKKRRQWERMPDHKKLLAEKDVRGKRGGSKEQARKGSTSKDEWAAKGAMAESPELIDQLKSSNKGKGPVQSTVDGMQFTMSTYKWTWKRYMQNWAIDLSRWWRPPMDYMNGAYPEGGYVWMRVQLSKEGEMLGYEILEHNVSSEMKTVVVQALMGARLRPALPKDFPDQELKVNWKFIYPPLSELIKAQKEAQRSKH